MQRQCPRILNYAAQLLSLFFCFFETVACKLSIVAVKVFGVPFFMSFFNLPLHVSSWSSPSNDLEHQWRSLVRAGWFPKKKRWRWGTNHYIFTLLRNHCTTIFWPRTITVPHTSSRRLNCRCICVFCSCVSVLSFFKLVRAGWFLGASASSLVVSPFHLFLLNQFSPADF